MPFPREWSSFDDDDEDDDFDLPIEGDFSFGAEKNWLEASPLAAHINRENPFDPLGLIRLCSSRARERALILDLTELVQATLSRVALHCESFDPTQPLLPWLVERVDDSIEALLTRDAEAERGEEAELLPQGRFTDLEMILGIEPEAARLACVTLNTLDDETRHVFYEVCLMHRSERDLQRDGFPLERTQELVQAAVQAVKAALERARDARLPGPGRLIDPSTEPGGHGEQESSE
jgi:DNA-directed RNA polymerase specialized sigma24 family protein